MHEAEFKLRNNQIHLTVLDQALVSGVNFATTLMLARLLMPSAYGEFVLAYSILWFVKNMHLGLITTPLMMIGPTLKQDAYSRSKHTSLIVHTAFIAGSSLLIILLGFVVPENIFPEGLFLPVAIAASAVLSQEYVRKILFTELRRRDALINDTVSYGLQLAGLVLWHYLHGLTPSDVLYIISISSAIACCSGFFQCSLEWRFHQIDWEFLARGWHYGKWLCGVYVSLWLSDRWYLFVTAIYLTSLETGILGACIGLLGLFNVFFLAFENFISPLIAGRVSKYGISALWAVFRPVFLYGTVSMGIACLLLYLFSDALMSGIFGESYGAYGGILGLLTIGAFVSFFSRMAAIGLKILQKSKEVFCGYTIVALVTIASSPMIVEWGGVEGAAIGMILTQVILAALFLWMLATTWSKDCCFPCNPAEARAARGSVGRVSWHIDVRVSEGAGEPAPGFSATGSRTIRRASSESHGSADVQTGP